TVADPAAARHCSWLRRGMHVVSNNKAANGGGLAAYHALLEARAAAKGSYQYGATVGGAALPIVATLQSLQSTGDDVRQVEGVISAALSYIFNPSPVEVPFSQALGEAVELGLLDARELRDHLTGVDAARRALILGRELGLELNDTDVCVAPVLLLAEIGGGGGGKGLDLDVVVLALDNAVSGSIAAARQRGNVLRYVCSVDAEAGSAAAGVREVPAGHDFGRLRGASFCVRYLTKGKKQNGAGSVAAAAEALAPLPPPLVLRGPVGGAPATASAMFADLVRVARDVGAR
ncbi:unnamed protein product, partial [Phaeothamnion confervicola]